MTFLMILGFGFLFGWILQIARLNRFNTISGFATLEDLSVGKALLVAIGLGMIILQVTIGLGFAAYHVKPFVTGGLIIGGILFGMGMAILGYCPGTMAVSLGEGSVDALVGILGGLLGGLFYTLLLPSIKAILGTNLGKISLYSVMSQHGFVFYLLVVMIGSLLVYGAFYLNRIDKSKDKRWLYSGVGLAVLNGIVFLKVTTNRPIGASTSYPYLSDVIGGLQSSSYFTKIQTPGHWELIFLGGAFLSGLILSLVSRRFKLQLVYERWQFYKGKSEINRIVWAFVGGFILIFGARLAGGCTSGHILSGGMQLALSSFVFALVVLASLLITGKVFYKK